MKKKGSQMYFRNARAACAAAIALSCAVPGVSHAAPVAPDAGATVQQEARALEVALPDGSAADVTPVLGAELSRIAAMPGLSGLAVRGVFDYGFPDGAAGGDMALLAGSGMGIGTGKVHVYQLDGGMLIPLEVKGCSVKDAGGGALYTAEVSVASGGGSGTIVLAEDVSCLSGWLKMPAPGGQEYKVSIRNTDGKPMEGIPCSGADADTVSDGDVLHFTGGSDFVLYGLPDGASVLMEGAGGTERFSGSAIGGKVSAILEDGAGDAAQEPAGNGSGGEASSEVRDGVYALDYTDGSRVFALSVSLSPDDAAKVPDGSVMHCSPAEGGDAGEGGYSLFGRYRVWFTGQDSEEIPLSSGARLTFRFNSADLVEDSFADADIRAMSVSGQAYNVSGVELGQSDGNIRVSAFSVDAPSLSGGFSILYQESHDKGWFAVDSSDCGRDTAFLYTLHLEGADGNGLSGIPYDVCDADGRSVSSGVAYDGYLLGLDAGHTAYLKNIPAGAVCSADQSEMEGFRPERSADSVTVSADQVAYMRFSVQAGSAAVDTGEADGSGIRPGMGVGRQVQTSDAMAKGAVAGILLSAAGILGLIGYWKRESLSKFFRKGRH